MMQINAAARSMTMADGITAYKDDDNAVLLDVRDSYDYQEAHIPGAVNVPFDDLDNTEFSADKPIYVYCWSGVHSALAAEELSKRGYDAIDIGGIMSYGGPLNAGMAS